MALIKCPECGKEISDKAASCPNCGFPISETKAPQKEREVELMGRMKARTEGENIEIYLDGNLLFREQFRDFTLLYNKEVTDELGSTQLKVAFSSPRYDRPFKICEKISSPRYRNAKDFAKEVAEKYFRKSYVVDWRLVEEYAREHCEKVDAIEPVKAVTETGNYSENSSQNAQNTEKTDRRNDDSFLASCGFTIAMLLLFCPIGLFTMWKYKHFSKGGRIAWTVVIALIVPLSMFCIADWNKTSSYSIKSQNETEELAQTVKENTEEAAKAENIFTEKAEQKTDPEIEEKYTLYENNGILVEADGFLSATKTNKISLHIENTSSKSYGVSSHAYAINGIMAGSDQYGFESIDVAPGKMANSSLELKDDWEGTDFFNDYQISKVNSFDILLWAYDNDKSYKSFDSGQIHVNVSDSGNEESPVFADAVNIYDSNGIKVDFLSKRGNEFTFCITNNTGKYFTFDADNISYNDFTSSDVDYNLYNEYILDGCKLVINVKPDNDFLEENGIKEVTKIDFSLKIRPLDDYSNEYSTDIFSVGW
nr:MAG TPA: zinc-ribbon domain protein [Caudoviricetes sp.]